MSTGGEIPIPFTKQEAPEVTTCLTGTVEPLPPISYCMDGALHALHTCFQDPVRLIPSNRSAMKDLDKFAGKHVVVTVCGYFRAGADCRHLEVFHVDEAPKVLAALKAAILKAPKLKCCKCGCQAFLPRVTNPSKCRRRGCGHSLEDHGCS